MATISAEKQHSLFVEELYRQGRENGWRFLDKLELHEAGRAGFLIRSPTPVLVVTCAYILFVCFIGPRYMKNREPYQLKTIIRFYNLAMVFLAGVLVTKLYTAIDTFDSFWKCEKVFNLKDSSASLVYQMADLILMVRISEYLDTIFFTLRKKYNQITFLHVFHHAFVPMYAYWILRTAPARFNIFIIFINSFIHILMYFYYFLATFQERPVASTSSKIQERPPKNRRFIMFVINKLLMFKKYMTQLQILQFFLLAFYVLFTSLRTNQCGVPGTYVVSNMLLAATFIGLFVHFYLVAYRSARTVGRKQKET